MNVCIECKRSNLKTIEKFEHIELPISSQFDFFLNLLLLILMIHFIQFLRFSHISQSFLAKNKRKNYRKKINMIAIHII